MKTAIDSSVLLALFNDGPGGRSWLEVLMQARREGLLVVCDMVYAELAPSFATESDLQDAPAQVGRFLRIDLALCCVAGGIDFRRLPTRRWPQQGPWQLR